MYQITILLTGCFNPNAGAMLVRTDVEARLNDYKNGLRFWLNCDAPEIIGIVFVENTGGDFTPFREIVSAENKFDRRVEFWNLGSNSRPEGVHYGYNELEMIDEVLACSPLLNEVPYFLKVTGRLVFPDITRLLSKLPGSLLFAVDTRDDSFMRLKPRRFIPTQLALFSTSFYKRELMGIKKDMLGRWFYIETMLHDLLIVYRGRNDVCMRFPVSVDPVGVAGHSGQDYQSIWRRVKNLSRSVLRKAFPWWWF
jgi:hypothetical protein